MKTVEQLEQENAALRDVLLVSRDAICHMRTFGEWYGPEKEMAKTVVDIIDRVLGFVQ